MPPLWTCGKRDLLNRTDGVSLVRRDVPTRFGVSAGPHWQRRGNDACHGICVLFCCLIGLSDCKLQGTRVERAEAMPGSGQPAM